MTITRPDGKMLQAIREATVRNTRHPAQNGSLAKPDTSHSSRAMAQDTSGIEYHTVLHPASAVKNK